MGIIEVKNLSFAYDESAKTIDEVSFSIEEGTYTTIIGHNGSGKSTLIKILSGLNNNYSGEIKPASNLKISYIPQNTSDLHGSLVRYIKNMEADETLCKTILRKLGFSRELFETDMQNYSDGQKKKVLLSISLSKPAHLFVWDEPLNYIDVISRIQIEEIIKESNPTLVLVEHDRRFVEDVANKIIYI